MPAFAKAVGQQVARKNRQARDQVGAHYGMAKGTLHVGKHIARNPFAFRRRGLTKSATYRNIMREHTGKAKDHAVHRDRIQMGKTKDKHAALRRNDESKHAALVEHHAARIDHLKSKGGSHAHELKAAYKRRDYEIGQSKANLKKVNATRKEQFDAHKASINAHSEQRQQNPWILRRLFGSSKTKAIAPQHASMNIPRKQQGAQRGPSDAGKDGQQGGHSAANGPPTNGAPSQQAVARPLHPQMDAAKAFFGPGPVGGRNLQPTKSHQATAHQDHSLNHQTKEQKDAHHKNWMAAIGPGPVGGRSLQSKTTESTNQTQQPHQDLAVRHPQENAAKAFFGTGKVGGRPIQSSTTHRPSSHEPANAATPDQGKTAPYADFAAALKPANVGGRPVQAGTTQRPTSQAHTHTSAKTEAPKDSTSPYANFAAGFLSGKIGARNLQPSAPTSTADHASATKASPAQPVQPSQPALSEHLWRPSAKAHESPASWNKHANDPHYATAARYQNGRSVSPRPQVESAGWIKGKESAAPQRPTLGLVIPPDAHKPGNNPDSGYGSAISRPPSPLL